jgi:hypothetical protein
MEKNDYFFCFLNKRSDLRNGTSNRTFPTRMIHAITNSLVYDESPSRYPKENQLQNKIRETTSGNMIKSGANSNSTRTSCSVAFFVSK